jgi:hypothetical protein
MSMISRAGAREPSAPTGLFVCSTHMGAMQFKLVEFSFARCCAGRDGRSPLRSVVSIDFGKVGLASRQADPFMQGCRAIIILPALAFGIVARPPESLSCPRPDKDGSNGKG